MDTPTRIRRLLIADDYPDVAEMLADLISLTAPFPIEIAIVHDGSQAVAKAVADHPDCAILDVDMPELDGASAAVEIRSRLGADSPLFIALTGDSRHFACPKARGVFDHMFAKPADVAKLLSLMAP